MCFPMRVKLVRIGNSRGVLIPKAVLDQLGLEGELDLVHVNRMMFFGCPAFFSGTAFAIYSNG